MFVKSLWFFLFQYFLYESLSWSNRIKSEVTFAVTLPFFAKTGLKWTLMYHKVLNIICRPSESITSISCYESHVFWSRDIKIPTRAEIRF